MTTPASPTPRLEDVLKAVFGFSAFRPNQRAIVDAVLSRRDAFLLMATGAGKSLSYQLPSVYLRAVAAAAGKPSLGTTVVVSPLLALIDTQVDALRAIGVPAAALTSATRGDAALNDAARRGHYAVLYVTPERVATPDWQRDLRAMAAAGLVHAIAIDEAHCLTEEHQILTNKGFMFLHDLEADARSDLLVAGYDHATAQLIYERCSALVINPAASRLVVEVTNKTEAWRYSDVDGLSVAANAVSFVVTQEHDLFVCHEGTSRPQTVTQGVPYRAGATTFDSVRKHTVNDYVKVPAGRLVTADVNDTFKLLGNAVQGVHIGARAATVLLSELAPLALATAEQTLAFLQLYGYWLGRGSMLYSLRHPDACQVHFLPRKATEDTYLVGLLREVGLLEGTGYLRNVHRSTNGYDIELNDDRYNAFFNRECKRMYADHGTARSCAKATRCATPDESPAFDGIESVQCLAKWWRHLNRDQARAVLRGLREADGLETANVHAINTSSARFRDEIVTLALHAGYSPTFTLCADVARCPGAVDGMARDDRWRVTYSDRGCAAPRVHASRDVKLIEHTGRTWCVTMPHGFIFARRAKAERGVVLKASRPIIMGNCVSQWGLSFREDYRKLAVLRTLLPDTVPLLALTATATDTVRADVIASLRLRDPVIVTSTFNRPNLFYEVARRGVRRDETAAALTSALASIGPGGSVVMYTITTKEAERVADIIAGLPPSVRGGNVAVFHAKLTPARKTAVLHDFMHDRVRVVVATIAFGMGVDKKDIRGVVNVGAPASLEAYYQQTGRAGRDGAPARCITLWAPADFEMHAFLAARTATEAGGGSGLSASEAALSVAGCSGTGTWAGVNDDDDSSAEPPNRGSVGGGVAEHSDVAAQRRADLAAARARERQEQALSEMRRFLVDTKCCRRAAVLEYFGETLTPPPPCGGCDNCMAHGSGTTSSAVPASGAAREYDLTADLRAVGAALRLAEGRGLTAVVELLSGRPSKPLRGAVSTAAIAAVAAAGAHRAADYWRAVIPTVFLDAGVVGVRTVAASGRIPRPYTTYALTPAGRAIVDTPGAVLAPRAVPPEVERFLPRPRAQVEAARPPPAVNTVATQMLTPAQQARYDALVAARLQLAEAQHTTPFALCPTVVLRSLATAPPTTERALNAAYEGWAPALAAAHGSALLRCLYAALHAEFTSAAAAAAADAAPDVAGCSAALSRMRATAERVAALTTDVRDALVDVPPGGWMVVFDGELHGPFGTEAEARAFVEEYAEARPPAPLVWCVGRSMNGYGSSSSSSSLLPPLSPPPSPLVTAVTVARHAIAEEMGVADRDVVDDIALATLVEQRPVTVSGLRSLRGWPEAVVAEHGARFLAALASVAAAAPPSPLMLPAPAPVLPRPPSPRVASAGYSYTPGLGYRVHCHVCGALFSSRSLIYACMSCRATSAPARHMLSSRRCGHCFKCGVAFTKRAGDKRYSCYTCKPAEQPASPT